MESGTIIDVQPDSSAAIAIGAYCAASHIDSANENLMRRLRRQARAPFSTRRSRGALRQARAPFSTRRSRGALCRARAPFSTRRSRGAFPIQDGRGDELLEVARVPPRELELLGAAKEELDVEVD